MPRARRTEPRDGIVPLGPGVERPDLSDTYVLESRKVADGLEQMLSKSKLSYDDMREIIRKVFVDDDRVTSWVEALDEHETAYVNDGGKPSWEDQGLLRKFSGDVTRQYTLLRQGRLDLSQLGLSSWSIQAKRTARWIFVDDLFIRGIMPGRTGVVRGIPGTGKTDFAVHELALPWMELENPVVSNIYVENPPERYHYETTLSGSLQRICEGALEGKITLKLYDEPQIRRVKMRATTRENLTQKQLSHLFRKFSCFEVLVTQRIQDVPSEVMAFLTHDYWKSSSEQLGWVDVHITAPKTPIDQRIYGVRGLEDRINSGMPYLHFLTEHVADMQIDLALIPLLNYVEKLTRDRPLTGKDQMEEIIDYIEKRRGKEILLGDEEIGDFLALIKQKHPDYGVRQLAPLVGWNTDKVYHALKARGVYAEKPAEA